MPIFARLTDRFWEPYLPYEITETQKLIEDTKDIDEPSKRVSALLQIFDQSFSNRDAEATQRDIYQGLKFLSMHGKLPFVTLDSHHKRADDCIVKSMITQASLPRNIVEMVGALCNTEIRDSAPSRNTKKAWAERTYKDRYGNLELTNNGPNVPANVSANRLDEGVDLSRRNVLMFRAPE